ncbi:MAG: AI-2E family transporter [Candidatus Magasanikbacteria bacterium]|nr:AI-2E family transporter [Candidatus Magasanikbacteria bacterium]
MPLPYTTSFKTMRSAFFFSLLILLGLLSLYVIRPFAYPIFWAAVVAVMFYPVYMWVDKHIKLPTVSSVITVILVIVILFLPLMLISVLLVQQSADLYQQVSTGDFTSTVEGVSTQIESSQLAPVFEKFKTEWTSYAASAAKTMSVFIFDNIKNITQNSIKFIFLSALMLYSLYFFLKDGKRILETFMHLSPLGDNYEIMLYRRFTSTARATLKSTLILGGIQGILGGILFALTGVQGAFIWGVIMTVLSIIPAFGSFLVWLPAGIIMLTLGFVWQGIAILLVGAIIISNVDNILRPIMVGKDTQMHPLLVLFSTLGGIFFFGISGFIIGPVIISLFLAVLSIYEHYYTKELKRN